MRRTGIVASLLTGRTGIVASLLAVGLLVAACAQPDSQPGAPDSGDSGPGGTVPPTQDPAALVGSWSVTGTGTVLRLAPDQLSIFDDCGVHSGTWRADTGGLFVGYVYAHVPADTTRRSCASADSLPAWLVNAAGFEVTGDGAVLLDPQGQAVARLSPGARPSPPPGVDPAEAAPPTLTDEVRQAFRPAAPLPAGLTPAGRDAMIGRWVPASGPAVKVQQAYVELLADGAWRGSDGCNGQGGRWTSGPAGALLAVTGASTLIGCANVPVADWLSGAHRAGLDGEVLVLCDVAGTELGRLRRDG
ncbi:hypothetical protein [Plantactinospora sp. GCM10030261]|uniref:hypothetical protein n=1 Tax=Plantactinospora sp. GCM10030261 TaxID=3273420 RepID=UPI0036163329